MPSRQCCALLATRGARDCCIRRFTGAQPLLEATPYHPPPAHPPRTHCLSVCPGPPQASRSHVPCDVPASPAVPQTLLKTGVRVSSVGQVELLFGFISPLVVGVEGEGEEELDDEVRAGGKGPPAPGVGWGGSGGAVGV